MHRTFRTARDNANPPARFEQLYRALRPEIRINCICTKYKCLSDFQNALRVIVRSTVKLRVGKGMMKKRNKRDP